MRSRRGGSVNSSATSFSSSSSTHTDASGAGADLSMFSGTMDLESIAEQVFEHLSITGSDPDTLQASSYSDVSSSAQSQDGGGRKQDGGGRKQDGGGRKQDGGGRNQDGYKNQDGGCKRQDGGCKNQDGVPKQDGCRFKDGCRSKDGRRTPRLKARVSTPSVQAFKQDGRLSLNFVDAISGAPNRTYYKLFRGILSWINPDLNVFVCSEKTQTFSHDHELNDHVRPQKKTVDIPDLAVVLFLQEELTSEDGTMGKMSQVREFFQHKPWRFHHSEWVGQGRIQACPQSNHDYFFVKHDLPLCSVRQIHCGEEHIRLVRFVTAAHWKDSLKLYSLLLAQEPDAMKQDFCLFTVEKFGDVDLQLALKKLPKGIEPRHTRKCVLSFKIKDIGYLVPLLPHACIRIAEHRWKTYDLDRNEVHILVEDTSPKPIRAPQLLRPRGQKSRAVSSHVRQLSSSSDSQASGHSGSAFTPVHGSISQIQKEDPGDKLSPRVYINKDLSAELVSKVQSGLQNRTREVYSPMPEPEYEHQHTDSGFMDERSDDSTDNRAHLQIYTRVQVHPEPDFSTRATVSDSSTHDPEQDPSSRTTVPGISTSASVPDLSTSGIVSDFSTSASVSKPSTIVSRSCEDFSSTNAPDAQDTTLSNTSNQNACNCDSKLSTENGPKKHPLCHSSPKSEHSTSPTWDTALQNSMQDTSVCNSTQDTTSVSNNNTRVDNANTCVLHSTNYNTQNVPRDTNFRTSTQDNNAVHATTDTGFTSFLGTAKNSDNGNNTAEYHSNRVPRSHSQHLSSSSSTDWNTEYAVPQHYRPSSCPPTQQSSSSEIRNKPPLPSYQEAVNILAAKRQQADIRSAKLMQVSDQMHHDNPESTYTPTHTNYYSDYNVPQSRTSVAHYEQEEANEGEPEPTPEPEKRPSCTSILSDVRRDPFRRRASSNGKRVRFNDVNENFTYEPVETIEEQVPNVEELPDDVFFNDRVENRENRAEGSECVVPYDEVREYSNQGGEFQKYVQNGVYGNSMDLHWHQAGQTEGDSGFYI